MMTSMTVSALIRAALATPMESFTALANCWFVAKAIYRGKLAAAVAAFSAALQPEGLARIVIVRVEKPMTVREKLEYFEAAA